MTILTTAVLATLSILLTAAMTIYVAGAAVTAAVVFPALVAERVLDRRGYHDAQNTLHRILGLTLLQAAVALTVLWPWGLIEWARTMTPVGSTPSGASDARRRSHR